MKAQGEIMELNYKKSCLNRIRGEEYLIIYKFYYPLSGRLQIVSKKIFSEIEGKIFKTFKVKIKIIYPNNYPTDKKVSNRQILKTLNANFAFEAEGLFSKVSSIYKSLNVLAETIGTISSLGEKVWEKNYKSQSLEIIFLAF